MSVPGCPACPVLSLPPRSKPAVDAGLSDKEIFDALPLKDAWEDARMLQVFDYLMSHPRTTVPASWENSMAQFHQELRDLVCNVSACQIIWTPGNIAFDGGGKAGAKNGKAGAKNGKRAQKKICSILLGELLLPSCVGCWQQPRA